MLLPALGLLMFLTAYSLAGGFVLTFMNRKIEFKNMAIFLVGALGGQFLTALAYAYASRRGEGLTDSAAIYLVILVVGGVIGGIVSLKLT